MLTTLVLAGAVMLFGSFVQGAIGFALGMIAVPLLVEAGFSLAQAVALTTLSIGIQVAFGAYQLRQHIPWPDVRLAVIVRYLTMPLGILILLASEGMAADELKRWVGIGVLLGVILRAAARQITPRELPLPLSVAIFALSGFLQGLVAMGGPPMVLWMTTRRFPAKPARAFTMTLFLFNAPLQVLLLLFLSRTMSWEVLAMALLLTPLIFIGTTGGVRLGNRFSKPALNRLALTVLVLIALNAIF